MGNRKVQPVSFNLADPFENKLYMFAMSNGAFSKYIKRLILKDQERDVIVPLKPVDVPVIPKKKAVASSFL
jgi:hypothetical protein